MRKGIILSLPILASVVSLLAGLHADSVTLTEFAGLHAVSAQNATNMTAGANMTNATTTGNMTGSNMTTANTSSSSAKTHLEEGIKDLQSGDKEGAMTQFTAAQQAMSGSTPEAINHFEEGMKALSGGDSDSAIIHLQVADQALG